MKKLVKVFLSFVFIFICSFSFVGCSDTDFYKKGKKGGYIDGVYYFNSEYVYEVANPSNKLVNSEVYAKYYGTKIKIKNNIFSIKIEDDIVEFKLIKDGKRYKLKSLFYGVYDEPGGVPESGSVPESGGVPESGSVPESGGVPETVPYSSLVLSSSELMVSSASNENEEEFDSYLDYSNGVVTITTKFDEEENLVLEYLEDASKVKTHDYQLYEVQVFNINTTDSVSTKRKIYNDFIDFSDENLLINYKRGNEYKYSMTRNISTYTLTLLTEINSEYATYETATLKTSQDKVTISYTTENENVTYIYKKLEILFESSDNDDVLDDESVSDSAISYLAGSVYEKFIRIVKIVLPLFIGVVVTFCLFFGIKLAVKYAKAEEDEEKKKVKDSLIGVIFGCFIVILIVTIIMSFI